MSTAVDLTIDHGRLFSRPQQQIVRNVVIAGLLMMLALAAWLAFRRTAGAVSHELSSLHLVALAIGTAFSLSLLRTGLHRLAVDSPFCTPLQLVSLSLFCTLVAILMGASVSGGRSPVGSVALLWAILATEEAIGWFTFRRAQQRRGRSLRPSGQDESPGDHSSPAPTELRVDLDEMSDDETAGSLPEEVSQRITRASDNEGQEVVYGQLRCHFAPGQRQQNLHVAFCPPLKCVPSVTVDQLDGPPAKVRATQMQTFGACIEVRLRAASSEPSDVQVQLFASDSTAAATWD